MPIRNRRVVLVGLLLAAGLCGCAATGPRGSDGGPPLDRVRTVVAARFETLEAPGAVFGVWRGAERAPVLYMPLGFADEEHTRPILREDHFRIGSLTKTFVGLVALQLVDEGLLDLSASVETYLPGVVPNGVNITVAMLGYHTSGLPRVVASEAYQRAIQADPGHQWQLDEILPYAWEMDPLFAPGDGWMYSNLNTMLLGEVIEAVTGRPWHEEVAERILRPLDLRETGYPVDSVVPAPTPRGYRFGQPDNLVRYGNHWFDATDWSGSCWGAAGDMYGTLDDIARFTRAAARGELVSEESRAVLFGWIDIHYDGIEYGFHIARRHDAIGTAGDVPGFSSFAMYLPQQDLTVVCLANLTATPAKLTAAAELGEPAIELLRRH